MEHNKIRVLLEIMKFRAEMIEDYQLTFLYDNPFSQEPVIRISWIEDRNTEEEFIMLRENPYLIKYSYDKYNECYNFYYYKPDIATVFTIYGEPKSKARHRTTIKGGKVISYRLKKDIEREQNIRDVFVENKPETPIEEPLELNIKFDFHVPKSYSKKKTKEALMGLIPHQKKPDIDNLIKLVKDAGNGIIWKDDSYIVRYGIIEKRYSAVPKTTVMIRKIKGGL